MWKDSVDAIAEQGSGTGAKAMTPAVCIDLDRFCDDCGYNLRTQAVHRDAHTGIPVVRCPECGRFHAANHAATALRPWLTRVTAFLLAVWIAGVMAAFGLLALGEGAISYSTLDELTVRGGSSVQRINNMTIRTWSDSFAPLEVNIDVPEYRFFVTVVLACSFGLAFLCGLLVVVVCPHWCRLAGMALILATPLVVNAVVAIGWWYEAPHLFDWGLRYLSAHAGAQWLGGSAGILFGRPFARLAVRIILPPGVRPRLAYLWLADGKALPSPMTATH